jgi:predicted dinucleotide-binding enzyme
LFLIIWGNAFLLIRLACIGRVGASQPPSFASLYPQACRSTGAGPVYAGDDPHAIDVASSLIREIGFDPVVIGGLAMGKYLVPERRAWCARGLWYEPWP